MPVDSTHPLYEAHQAKVKRTRDAVAGSDAIKAGGKTYLRDPDPSDPQRFKEYKDGAQWVGITGRTHAWMLGAIFRKTPTVELPDPVAYLEDDANGAGMPLHNMAQKDAGELLEAGHVGMLVEYPPAPGGLTAEQTAPLRARLTRYESESIINWERTGGLLTLVVLRETYTEAVDEFKREQREQHRVLRLQEGVYTQQLYRDKEPYSEIMVPRRGDGTAWPFIPFQFIGARDNDERPDKPLLVDIADLNIGHYRNSADLEESAYVVGQAMPHVDIGQTDTQAWNELNPNGIRWGSRRGVQTQGGKLELIQAAPNTLPRELMKDKEEQIVAIGARLIEQRGGNEREEAVLARTGAETANLSSIASNISSGYAQCLAWALMFMSTTDPASQIDDIVFELNQEFHERTADPQMIMARLAELDRGVIADTDYFDWARKRGLIAMDRTDEDIRAEAEAGGTNLGAI